MIDVALPSLGPDMESGKLLQWRVQPGDAIKKGGVIAVVDTEKAAIDVESWHDGTVAELLVQPGDSIAVGTIILRLRESGDNAEIPVPTAGPRPESPAPAVPSRASPAARSKARELGIDLTAVRGSGPGGAITLDDVAQQTGIAPAPSVPSATTRHDSVRAAIAVAMVRSHREIPHYYLWDECDVSRALQWMQQVNAARSVERRLVPAALYLAAIARAAHDFPEMNGTYESDQFRPSATVHLGVAVALRGGGLIAPALRDAHSLSVEEIMQRLSDLVLRARASGLRSSEVSGQTITVTQLGEEGVRGVLGIIHPPQVALVGIGRPSERAVVESGKIVARTCVTISLAADHRVSDGRRGAQFLARITELMQQPEAL